MRMAVTGMGVVTPVGIGIADFTQALRKVTQSMDVLKNVPVPRGKASIGLVKDPAFAGPDRACRMAREALTQAINQSRPQWEREKCALIVSTLTADSRALEELYSDYASQPTPSVAVLEALPHYSNGALLNALGNEFGFFGPRLVISNACASGNLGMGIALDMMRLGQCNSIALVGVELVKLSVLWGAERAAFVGHKLRPFHCRRDGSILGEGAGALILEHPEHARKEQVLGWIEGFGCGMDAGAAAITLIEDGSGLCRAMRRAMEDAGRHLSEIEYINAHAPGTPVIDRVECRAIADLFGSSAAGIAINSTKGLTTHLSAASGVVESAATLIQMQEGFLHGNAELDEPDPLLSCPVIGQQTIARNVRKSLSNACGGGGLNTTVLLTRADVPETLENKRRTANRPIVITGIGSVSALGAGNWEVFHKFNPRRPAAGRLEWFNVETWFPPETNYRHMSRAAQLAAGAVSFAVREAKVEKAYPDERVAVLSGTLFGGSPEAAALLCGVLEENPKALLPSMALDHGIHLGAALVRRYFNFNGITYTFTGSPIAGLNAMKIAANLLNCDRAEAAVIVGHDSLDAPLQKAAGWFPKSDLGGSLSEGAGAVVLESLKSASDRGISPWCVIEEQIVFAASLETEEQREAAVKHLLGHLSHAEWELVFISGTAVGELYQVVQSLLAHSGLSASIHCLHEGTGFCMAADPMLTLCVAAVTGKDALVLSAERGGTIAAISLIPGSRTKEYIEEDSAILKYSLVTAQSPAVPAWVLMYQALEHAREDGTVPGRKAALQQNLIARADCDRSFPWTMKSGFALFISPHEGTVPFQTVGWKCFREGVWEPDVEWCLRNLLKPESICFDVGANLGYFTSVMAQCAPQGRIYAFEPMMATFARLESCLRLNAFSNVHAFPFAIGAVDGCGQLFVHESATGNASLHKDPIARLARAQPVEMYSLDSLLAQGLVELPHIIKIDVEGHELEVLRGAQQLISCSGTTIIFEFNERMSRLANWSAADLKKLLLSLGNYDFYLLQGGRLTRVNIEDVAVVRNTHVDMLAWNRNKEELPIGLASSIETHAF